MLEKTTNINNTNTIDEKTIEHLVNSHMKLIISIARKYASTMHDIDDLISVGKVSLVNNISKYDSSKGVKFSTFIYPCIKNAILSYIQKESKHDNTISIDEPLLDSDDEITIEDTLSSQDKDIKDIYEEKELREYILEIISTLNEKEQQIVILLFGFKNDVCYKPKEIAKILGFSTEYIYTKIRYILFKLRNEIMKRSEKT